ncbi:MAG: DNA polymerase I [Alphaproteobacteria bacterium]|nr:DNA polymerase I [Alphaproteobacteria bacterium]
MSKRVCLIDGSGYIFRAFYGLPPLTAPDGTPVNAVYGFTNMFLKLTTKIGCDYCLVLFDAKRQNFRNEIYPEYKGTRKEIPEDLIPQFAIIRKAVDALNLNYLEMEGYEADDLIATYSAKALAQGLDVTIVSGDKDLMQLIRPGVEFYDPMKDKFFTPEDVKEKFGVYPDKVVDVQALAGDSTDNVPGVPGIGPKTAAQLINEYGSLENVLARASEIKQEKRRQMLIDNAENARISLQLVSLKKDVPVEHNLNEYICRNPDAEKLNNFIAEYEFKTLKPRVEKWISERCSDIADRGLNSVFKDIKENYKTILSEQELVSWLKDVDSSHKIAIDVASDGLNPFFDNIYGVSLASSEGCACYVPLAVFSDKSTNLDLFAETKNGVSFDILLKNIYPLLRSRSTLKVAHNLKYIMHVFGRVSKNFECLPYDDVSVLSYDLDSSEHGHGIEELAMLFLEKKLPKKEDLLGTGKNKINFSQLNVEEAQNYMCKRVDYCLRLHTLFKNRLIIEHKTTIYENYDRPLLKTLYEMEQEGVAVNAQSLQELSRYFEDLMKNIEIQAHKIAGEEFNLASPKQVGEILFVKQGIKGKKTAGGSWATGAEILEEIAAEGNQLAQKILEWRELSKLKSTYTDSLFALLDKDSRIHTTYLQTVANTGRLSSVNPNLQNIPVRSEEGRKIRSCFVAKKGYKLISSDYSQVELRLLANVADVKALKQAFAEGIDVHTATASHVFGVAPEKVDAGLRRQAKAINFGIVYGISAYGLAKNIGVETKEAKAYIDAYFKQMPEIKQYMEDTIAFAHKHEFVQTPFGRRCSVFGINDSNKRIVANAERAAINAPIQGGAADIIKLAMIKIEKEIKTAGLKTKMLLQVHDELIFESPDSEVEEASKIIKNVMENVVNMEVPFVAEVGVGANWTEAH